MTKVTIMSAGQVHVAMSYLAARAHRMQHHRLGHRDMLSKAQDF